MDMKWNPIVNGDLSEVPRDKYVLFTVLNEKTGEVYTAAGKVDEFCLQHYKYVFANSPVKCKALKAWTNLPEPYKTGRCDMCKHWEEWTDNFGDRYSKCELFDNVPFSQIISSKSCPIDMEISDDSN